MDLNAMKELRENLRLEWIAEGCPKNFSEWLLDRVEAAVKLK